MEDRAVHDSMEILCHFLYISQGYRTVSEKGRDRTEF